MRARLYKLEPVLFSLSLVIAAELYAPPAVAATRVWDGNGGNDNWGYFATVNGVFPGNTNWTDLANFSLPLSGDALVFQGSSRLTPFNDRGGLTIAGITFLTGAGAFTLNGNGIVTAGNIVNASGNMQTLNLPLTLGADQIWDGGTAGMTFGGTVQLGSNALTIDSNGTGNVILASGLSGSGALGKTGSGGLLLGGTSTAGATTVDGGSLVLSGGARLSSASAKLGEHAGESGAIAVSGANSNWTSSGDVYVGDAGHGTLEILNGASVDNVIVYLGLGSGSGTVLVDGANSRWTSVGLSLSYGSSLTIRNGGRVSTSDAGVGFMAGVPSTVTVDGANSEWTTSGVIDVGVDEGAGVVNLTNGGRVSSQHVALGFNTGTTGIATVEGPNSLWSNNGWFHVGDSGFAELNVRNGGAVISAVGVVAQAATSTATVTLDGKGSQWTNTSALTVGELGNGSLTIRNGARVTSAAATLGVGSDATGVATVDGPGSSWINAGDLAVGRAGQAALTISHGGTVESGGTLSVGSRGTLNLDGGTLSVAATSLTAGGEFNWTAGTLKINGALSFGDGTGGILDGDALSLNASQVLDVAGSAGFTANSFVSVAGGLHVGGDFDGSGVFSVATGGTATIDGAATNSGILVARGTLQADSLVNSGGIQLAGAGRLRTRTLALDGGKISGAALDMNAIGTLTGHGTVGAAVVGGTAANTIAASGGNLSLGDANAANGFQFGGHLDVGAGQVTLLDKDTADLGVGTSLGDGGKLVTVNGANLAAGRTLSFSGNARVQGDFTNNGQVSGSGGALTFLNDVNGAGGFSGSIVFEANFDPGNSPAAVDFHGGNATVDSHSTLNLEIFGSTPGSQYDQLIDIGTFAFHGALNLVFGNGFVPTAGETFRLFDFAAFEGAFDPTRITVTGFDPAQLNFSRLGIDGVLKVNAVPVPAAVWLFGSGFAGLIGRRRRR